MFKFTTLSVVFTLLTTAVFSQTTRTWNGSVSTSWSTAANWSPSGIPATTDHVVIVTGSNVCALTGNTNITNCTITSGTLNLSGFTLTSTGVVITSGGSCNNGTFNSTGTSATFSGTTFGAAITANTGALLFNGGTFNSTVTVTKTGASNDAGAGGCIFNGISSFTNTGSGYLMFGNNALTPDRWNADVTFTNSGSERILPCWNSAGNQFNGNIFVNTTGSSQGINFCGGSASATAVLAAGRTIAAGSSGLTAGYLILQRFTQLGTTAINLTATANTTYIQFGPSSSIGGNLNVTTTGVLFHGCTFNGTVDVTKTGSSNDAGNGGCVFNGVSTFTNNGVGYLMFGNVPSSPDIWNANVTFTNNGSERILPCWNAIGNQFNGDILVNTTGAAQGIHFCGGSASATATLAATRTISAGSIGLNTGSLILPRFTQLGSAPVNLTASGVNTTIQFGPNSVIGGNATVSAPDVLLNGCTFSGTTNFTKTGVNNSNSSGGNTFVGSSVFNHNGTGNFLLGNGLPDVWNSTATFNNNAGGIIYIAYNHSGLTTSFANAVVFNNITSSGGTPGIRVAEAGTTAIVTFNGSVNITNGGTAASPYILFGSGNNANIFNFNSTLTVNQSNTGSGAVTQFGGTATVNLADNVVVSNTSGNGSWIGFTMSGGTTTLATGKTITIGAGGFSNGSLYLRRFIQQGSTAQSFTMTGLGNLTIGPGSTFNGNVTGNVPSINLNGCTYNGTATFTKTGAAGDYSAGGNVYNGVCSITNAGANFLVLGNVNPDIYNFDVTFTNTGSERLLPGWVASGNQYNGNIYVNSSGSAAGINFNGGNSNANSVLAATKSIFIGSGGYTSGYLILQRFTQLGNAAINLTLGATSNFLQFGPNAQIGGNTTTSSPRIFLEGCLFQGTTNFTKTGNGNDGSSGGNTFTGTCVLNHLGSGNFLLGSATPDNWLSTATFNNTADGIIYVAHSHGGGTSTFNGAVTVTNTSAGGGNPGVRFAEGSTNVGVNFQSTVTINNAGAGNSNYVSFSNGGGNNTITFNGVVTVNQTNTGTGAITYFGSQATILLNENVVVNNTSGSGSWVGFSMNGGSTTLAAGKTISIGSTGFTNGLLYLRRFNQIGATPQSLTLTGNGGIVYGPSASFGGNVTSVSPTLFFNGSTFSGTTNCTKNGSSGDWSAGANLFTGSSVITNTASGNLGFGNGSSDVWLSDVTFNNSGSAVIYVAHNHNGATSTFNDAVTINVTSSGTATSGVRFAEASSTGVVVFNGPVVVNNAGTGTNNYVGFAHSTAGNIITFNNTLTINQTNTGTSATTYIGNNSLINLNDNVVISNTSGSGSWVGFAMNGGSATLASGKTISIGGAGFNNGNLYLRRFIQLGNTPQSLTLTGTAGLTYGPSSIFNGAITSVSPSLYINGCTYNSTSNITKNGNSGDTSSGSNVFVGDAILSNTGFGNLVMGSGSSDQWQGNATFNNSGAGVLYIAHNHNSATSTFSGNVVINVTSGGTAQSGVRFAEASSSGIVTFNGPVTVNNGGTGTNNFVGFANNTGGNIITFNNTLTVNQTNSGTTAITQIGNNSVINLNENVIVNNTSGSGSWVGFAMNGGSAILASGKTISIGATGFNNGILYLRRLTQVGTTSQTLNLTGTAQLIVQSSSTFNANLFYSAPQVVVEGSTFNGVSRFTKTGGSNNYSAGGNTFNGNTHFINTGIGDFGLANGNGDDFNALARFVQTGTGLMRPIHNATSTFSGNIALDSCTTAITFGTAGNGIMLVDGNSAQQFNGDVAFIPTVNRLIMNNATGGSLTLNVPVINSGNTVFTNGDIFTTGTNYYRFNSGATYTGVSNSSHIAGIARRMGTGSFVYPVGNGTVYQPVTVNPSANATGMDVQYFVADAGTGPFIGGVASPPNLTSYNTLEYWNINPVTTATGTVAVNWDGINDPAVTVLAEARVGHKFSGNWQNEGATTSGTIATGTVTSDPISTWGPFTLGLTCPTPISITCPASVTVAAPTGSCTAAVTLPLATAAGVCGTTVITNSFNSNGANASGNYPIGITTVTYTATAASGSSATCSMTVTVTDNQGPILSCPPNITQNLTSGCDAVVTVAQATAVDQCVQRYSLNFAGGTEAVTTPNAAALQLTGSYTIEASVLIEGTPTDWVRIAGKGATNTRNYGLWYHRLNNTWLFQAMNSDGSTVNAQFNSVINANQWYHVAGVKNGNSYSLYLDGVLVATANTNLLPLTSTDPFTVGFSTFHTSHIGNIDNVRLWNSALSAAQIACSATGTPCANPSGLIINYDFESGIGGPVVFNRASSSHNGTASATFTTSDWETVNAPGNGVFITNNRTNTCDASGTYSLGTSSVLWTATDASGNTSTCTSTVTLVDALAPTITCPATINANTAAGTCGAVVNYTVPVAIDNCGNCASPPTISGMTLLGTNNGTAYYISNATTNWNAANAAVIAAGGYLASVNSAAENAYLLNAVTTSLGAFTPYWLGLSDVVSEGTFVWSNGQPVTYSNWNSGQPDNSGNEDFVQVWTASGTWNDLSGSANLRFVMELPCIPVARTAGLASGSTFPLGTTVVTHSATDGSGNTVLCSFNVVVTDNIAPTITCPATQTLNLNASCAAVLPNYTTLATVSDNCTSTSNLVITQSPAAGASVSGTGTTAITLTVQDQAGNTSNCTFSVTRLDTTAPAMVCPANITTNVSGVSCSAPVNYTLSMTDNCTTPVNCSPDNITGFVRIGVFGGHTYFRSTTPLTWTAANTQANALGGHLITIASAAENAYVQSFANHWIGLTDQVTEGLFTWVTGEPLTYTNWPSGQPDNSGGNEDYAAIWSTSGTWNDWTTAGTANYIVEFDCSYNLLAGLPSGSTFPVGTTVNTYTVTDVAGNTSAPCSFNVVVVDNINPTITCPSNIINTVTAGSCTRSVNTTNPTFADNCSVSTLTWTMTGATSLTSPVLGLNYVGTQIFNIGVTTITYIASDASGNTATCSFTVTINDNINPTIVCPSNITQSVATGSCTASVVTPAPVTSDNCSVSILRWALTGATIANSPLTGINNLGTYIFNIGTTTVNYTVLDGSGNSSVCSFNVVVADNIFPTITCPSNISANVGVGSCAASVVTTNPTYSDNCAIAKLTWTMSGATVAVSSSTGINNIGTYSFNAGTTIVTYSVEDTAGNLTTCSFNVVVTDNINPTIACPSNVTATAGSSGCSASVATSNPTTGDNCSVSRLTWAMTGATVATSPTTGINNVGTYSFNVGITTVTYTVRDANNNSVTCTFTVTVTDSVVPVINCPANVTVNVDPLVCEQTVTVTNPTISDNCTVSRLTWSMTGAIEDNSPSTGTNYVGTYVFPQGVTTINYTVTDAGNNSATCSFTVTVNDNIAPTIVCPPAVTGVLNPTDCYASGVALGIPTVDDNCGVEDILNNAPANFLLGATTVTWTVTDVAGLTATCAQTVVITDNIAPTMTCGPAVTANAATGLCNAPITITPPTVTELCNSSNALAFDGTNDFVNLSSNVLSTATSFTYEAWVYVRTHKNWARVLDMGNGPGISMYLSTSNALTGIPRFAINIGGGEQQLNATSALPTNTWKHIAVTLSGTTARLYIDGVQVAQNTSFSLSPASLGNTSINRIGRSQTASHGYFDGIIDEVRFWNVARTQTQIQQSMGVSLNGNEPGLLRYFKMNQGVGGGVNTGLTTLTATAGNNATLTNFALNGTTSNFVLANNASTNGVALSNNFNNSSDASGAYPVGTTNITWTATDASGNSATCIQTVTVSDTQLPTITCPANLTVNASIGACSANSVNLGIPVTTDNCSVATVTNDAPANFPIGVTNVIWTVTDASGNTATCTQTVTVVDNQLPTITCPANVTVNAANGTCAASSVNLGTPTTADNCSVASVTNNAPATYNVGVTNVIWTVTDASGNTATCTQTVTVVDNQLPTITCPANVTVNAANGTCSATSVNLGTPTTADNCSVASVTNNAPATYPVGVTNVIWTVTDASGNTATCTQTVTAVDNQLPTITCPANVTVNAANGTCSATSVNLGTPTTADNCSVASVTNNAPATYPVGVTNVIWTVTDASGNTATCTQTVTVVDNQLPTITCPANVTVNAANGTCSAIAVNLGTPTTADNCSVASVTNNAPATYNVGVTNVIWTVTDASGNTATCTQTVIVVDNQLPTITCPANVTVNAANGTCSATSVNLGTPTTADNCSVASVTNNAPATYPVGVTNVIWTVTDASGNTATCTQTVTVVDNQLPTITCPANVTVNAANGTCSATSVNLGTPTTADNCSVASVTNNAPATYNVGVTNVIWTVTDASGNTATCTQTVTVVDNQLPTITCPANVTVNAANGTCTATSVNLGTPTTADNCSVASVTNNAPATYSVGVTNVIWTVTDASGNTATCTQTVTVVDNQLPTISCQSNITANSNAGTCTASVVTTNPTIADNCAVASLTWSMTGTTVAASASNGINNVGSYTFNSGITTVTYVVTDASGNSASCSFTVTISDNILPTISCGANVTANAASGLCTANINVTNPVTADNCVVTALTWTMSGATVDASPITGLNNIGSYVFNVGVTTIEYTVFDGVGNSATCSKTVTIIDNQQPTITCPADVAVNTDADACEATGVDLGTPTTADNCTVATVTNDAPASFPVGTTTVTWTVVDGAGNIATCTQEVTVSDSQLPSITCPSDVTVDTDNNSCEATNVILGTPTTADNCTVATVTNDAPASFPVGTTTVTWTVVDGAGNSATCTQAVTVNDSQLPTITCPADVAVNTDNNACEATGVDLGIPTTADNCTVASVTNDAPANFPLGSTTVTWTVTDAAGNQSTCTQVVIVSDSQLPTITCPADVAVNTDNNACEATSVDLGTPTTADNCTVASVTNDAPASFPVGTTTVTWTVVDGAGNIATCTQEVTVSDSQLPSITCPSDVTVDTDNNSCEATNVILGTPTTADNCTVATVTNDAPASFPVGTTTVTWTVVDGAGNSATCTQAVTVNDSQLPSITCPADVAVNTDNNACEATGVDLGIPTTADNCTVASVTNDAPANFPLGSTTVTWTVTDAAGNQSTCTQVVIVSDSQLPTITCPADVAVNTDNNACEATGVDLGTPTTADNCTVATVTNDAPASFPVGTTTVTWTVVDGAGNSATCTQEVTVSDSQLPSITCPSDVTVDTDNNSCEATNVILGTPTTADNCTVATVTNDAPASFPVGTTTVTWTVVDGAGNSATCTQAVTVNDSQLPSITCPADVAVNTDNNACEATGVDLGIPTTADNCTVASVTNDAPANFPLGSTTLTWTVTDAAGNQSTCTQVVIVSDSQLPTITCPADVAVNTDNNACEATGVDLGTPTTADNCTVATVTNDAPASFPVGTTTVTWTVVDGAGNIATCTQEVTVSDSQLPSITCPSDVTVDTDNNSCEATNVILGTPTTADNCTVATVTNDAPASFPVGTTTVTWTVVDGAGNSATCTQAVTVNDSQLPSITCPADVAVNTDNNACEATGVDLGIPTTADNCTVASVTNDAPANFPLGSTTVTWTVTDAAGNQSTCTQVVIVSDSQLPTITCPADVAVNTDNNACEATGVDLGTPTTADNCTVATVTNDAPASFPVGTTTVTWTVVDGAGNSATCTQEVTVSDSQLPSITCPSDVTVDTDNNSCEATNVILGTPTTADNCTVATVTNDAPASFPVGTTTVTWTVVDGAGNSATCTQAVTVNDSQLPSITCPADVAVNTDNNACEATGVDLGIPTTADNCTVASVTNDAPANFPLGSTTLTWTVTDAAGNQSTCTQVVIVSDSQLPTITCPADVAVNTDNNACEATGVDLGTPTTADNCTVASVTNDAPASFPVGTTTVTWTVVDGAGNIATCTQEVTVSDSQLPSITCPSDVTVDTDNNSCEATNVILGTPTTADNCTVATVTNDAPASFPVGTTTVTWTVVDGAGNSATCTQVLTVNDSQLPSITCPADVAVNTDNNACEATGVDLGIPTTADNCTVASVTNDAPANFPLGSTTLTWTVTDAAGNQSTCTQVVIVSDSQLPTITCPADVAVNTDNNACEATSVDLGTPTTADNCTVATVTNDAPSTFPLGSTTVTWTVVDGAGNIATCTQEVTVSDSQLPSITCPADVVVNPDTDSCEATGVDLGTPTNADNCTVASVTNDAPASFPTGTTTVIWTVLDASGNMSTCSQLVTVNDEQAPTIICPINVTVNTDADACEATSVDLGTPTTADNCTVASVTNDAPANFPLGSTTVTWTVTDAAGNQSTCTQVVIVNDSQLPTITCPADVAVNTDADACEATGVDLGTPTTADNCTVATVTNDAPASFPVGATTVTWTVVDGAGNSATCTQEVTVNDSQLPSIACPADVTVNTDNNACEATGVDLGTPTTADNCTVATVTNDAPANFPVGTTTVTWTVVDGAGNSATCTQVVTVNDSQLPSITCPADVAVNTDNNACEATGIDLGTPTTADNCTVASVTNDAPANFPLGSTTVTWTVTDAAGNQSTCTQVVIVNDSQLPTITCPADVAVNTDADACEATGVDLGTPTTADNCTVATVTNDAPASFPVGATTVTWTVVDGAGNSATCTQEVTVNDSQLPSIACPADVTVNTDNNACEATGVDLGTPTTADNCTVATVTNDAPANFPVGTTTVTWTVVDGAGNSATCTQVVTVNDSQLPSITCPADVAVNTDNNACEATGIDLGTQLQQTTAP